MKSVFPGHYRPSEEEFAELWQKATFAFDASSLLHLYRLPERAREELLETLQKLAERLWVPYQAALEYQENRLNVIQKQWDTYGDFQKVLREARTQLLNEAEKLKRHPVLQPDKVLEHLDEFVKNVDDYFASRKDPYPLDPARMAVDDPIRDQLTSLFEGKVGQAPSADELEVIHAEGARRYEKEIPPGFEDRAKKGSRSYGDFVVWKQVMARAGEEERPIILIIDDEKRDWWWTFRGKKLGPHPDLVTEFRRETGQQFYMYNTPQLLKRAAQYLDQEVSEEALREAAEAKRQQQEESTPTYWSDLSRTLLPLYRDPAVSRSDEDAQLFFSRDGARLPMFPPPLAHELLGITRQQLNDLTIQFNVQPRPVALAGHVELRYSPRDLLVLTLAREFRGRTLDNEAAQERVREIRTLLDSGRLLVSPYAVATGNALIVVGDEDLAQVVLDLEGEYIILNLHAISTDLLRRLRALYLIDNEPPRS